MAETGRGRSVLKSHVGLFTWTLPALCIFCPYAAYFSLSRTARQCCFRKTDSSCPPKRQINAKDIFRTSLKATNKKRMYQPMIHPLFLKEYSENSTLDFCLSWTLSDLCALSLLCGISCLPEREKRQRQFPVYSCDVVSPAAGIPVPNARYSCSQRLVLLFPTGREFCSQSVGTVPCSPWNDADSILHASH